MFSKRNSQIIAELESLNCYFKYMDVKYEVRKWCYDRVNLILSDRIKTVFREENYTIFIKLL